MDLALETDENGDFKHALIVWSDVKKSAKSTLAAAVALWRAFQLEWGSIKVVANDLKQAQSRSYFYLERCLRLNPETAKMIERGDIKITRYTIDLNFNHTTIEAIPADPKGEAGGNDDMVLFTELWTYQHDTHKRMWTEMVVPPNKWGKSFRWAESYAGFRGQSVILEELYNSNVKDEYRLENTQAPLYKNSGTFVMWNQRPRLPWQNREYYCLPLPDDKDDLLVLTRSGWKPAEDVTQEDELCTAKDGVTIEYQKPTSLFKERYNGDLVRLHHNNVDLSMTPNHRLYGDWVNRTRHYKKKRENGFSWKFIEAHDAANKQNGWIPGHGNWNHDALDVVKIEDEVYDASGFVELLGWYIAEGSVGYACHTMSDGTRKCYPVIVGIAQGVDKNDAKYQHVVKLCEKMELSFTENKSGVRIFDAKLARYMEQFGKSCDRFVPRFVLDACSQDQMKLFLMAFARGDGSLTPNKDTWLLSTNSDRLKMDLCELAFKCGYRVSDHGSWSSFPETGGPPIHRIYVTKSLIEWWGYGERNNWSITPNADVDVWCPTLPNGNFCIMVNGRTMWTGNSQQRSELSEEEFRRVHHNEWVGSTTKFVQDTWWDSLKETLTFGPSQNLNRDEGVIKSEKDGVVVGCDAAYAEGGDYFSIVVVGKHPREDGRMVVREAKFWRAGSDGKLVFKDVDDEENPEYPYGYVCDLAKKYRVLEVAYDPYQLHSMATEQNRKRIAFWKEFTQGKPRTVADNALYDAIRDGTIAHNGNKTLSQHVKAAGRDSKGRLVKLSKDEKIDGAVALSMAYNRARYYRL